MNTSAATSHTPARCRDVGSITAFTLTVSTALFAFAGLILDGGIAVSTKVDAVSAAQAAARAGARELDVAQLRASGNIQLDPVQAGETARRWLDQAGYTGTVDVSGDTVTVSVHTSSDTQLLQLVGVDSIDVRATATATAIQP